MQRGGRGSLRAWVLAARPRTLPAAAAPVLAGTALAAAHGVFRAVPALAALAGALLIQIAANLANDLDDFRRGADTEARVGPLRVTQAGLLSPRAVRAGLWAVVAAAVAVGALLVAEAGWPVAVLGAAAIAAMLSYTGGPFPFGYHGLGELFVFLFFGLVAVGGTYFVQARRLDPAALVVGVIMGLLASGILVVNNLRDVETDRAAGKRTLAVRFGVAFARREYAALLVGAYAVLMAAVAARALSGWTLVVLAALPQAASLIRRARREEGRALNGLLAATGALELVFAALLSAGLLIGT